MIRSDVYETICALALSGTYRFSRTLAEGLGTSSLLFKTPGLSLTVNLNGKTIWQSESAIPEGVFDMAQAVIPLPENPSGAVAFALILVFGIFLLGVSQKHSDFSLLPLMLAMMGFIVTQLIPSEGYYFLPEKLATTKEGLAHGFGIRQMEEIAEKYQSILISKTPDEHTFLAETALLLPLPQQ